MKLNFTWARPFRFKELYFIRPQSGRTPLLSSPPGLRMWVVSAASEPTRRSKQRENTTGYDHTEFRFINHRRQLMYFNVWFGKKDGFQIVQKDMSSLQISCGHHHHPHVVQVARISLTLSRHFPYRSSPQAGLLDNIPYPHIAAECMFVLVVLLLHGHVWGSTRVSCMSDSSNVNSFSDRRQVAVQLVSCGVLPPGLVQDCSQHSCVIAV